MTCRKPFLLSPAGKDYLWGGDRLNTVFEKNSPLSPLAESWECSVHPDGVSTVVSGEHSGKTLSEVLKEHPAYLGRRYEGAGIFPVLIKFIDAKHSLSVQVHPDDAYAREYENGQNGKTELWYVISAEKNASLVYGFRQTVDKETVRRSLADGTVEKYLRKVPVHAGDIFFIPPGTVHAIGGGILLAEIQESSNLTYRLYDYDRIGKDGKKRELHIEKALDVAVFTSSEKPKQPLRVLKYRKGSASEFLSRCRYFEVHRLLVNTSEDTPLQYASDELSYRVLLCIDGSGKLSYEGEELMIRSGRCIFVPASSAQISVSGSLQFLEIRG